MHFGLQVLPPTVEWHFIMCDVRRPSLTTQSIVNLPKLRAGPHGAVGEGSFALPDLLGQETGQGWEIHPCE